MRSWIRAMVVTVAALGTTASAQAETLADALIAAYRNSNLLDQNRAVLRAADEDVAVAVSALRPVISYTASAGWQRTDDAVTPAGRATVEGTSASLSLSAELLLLDFGRRQFGISIARESVLATRQALVQVEQEVLLSAVSAYVDVRLAQEMSDRAVTVVQASSAGEWLPRMATEPTAVVCRGGMAGGKWHAPCAWAERCWRGGGV